MIRVIVNGCCGRMGQRIASLVHADPDMEIAGGLEIDGHPNIGKDLGQVSGLGELGVRISTSIETEADVLIETVDVTNQMALVDLREKLKAQGTMVDILDKNAAIIFKNKYKSYWYIVSKTI